MTRERNRLTALKVAKLREPGLYFDGGGTGLALQISDFGTKSWVLRFRHAGRTREMGLGGVDAVPLADDVVNERDGEGKLIKVIRAKGARTLAAEARQLIREGIDPIETRKAKRAAGAAAVRVPTFGEAWAEWLKQHKKRWTSPRTEKLWDSTMKKWCAPIWNVSVNAVDRAAVLRCVRPEWSERSVVLSRVLRQIEVVLAMSKTLGYGADPDAAAWRDGLATVLPPVKKHEPHPRVGLDKLPKVIGSLRKVDGQVARALELVALTAVRSGEALGARWSEIDLDSGTWTIPAARMKARTEHRVALSRQAVDLLKALRRDGELVFPSTRGKSHLMGKALRVELQRHAPDAVVHGLRADFSTWAHETTNVQSELIEASLAHAVGNAVARAYNRSDFFDRRRELMQSWADYLDGKAAKVTDIAQERKARRRA